MNELPTEARQRLQAELDSMLVGRFRPLVAGKRPGRVLVADARDDQRGLLAYLLKTHAYEVTEVSRGREVLSAVAQSPGPDLVIADFDLPGLNGYELMRELRSQHETRDLPLLLLTSATDRERLRGLLLPQCQCLGKPTPNRALLQAVATALPPELVSRPAKDGAGEGPAPAEEEPPADEGLDVRLREEEQEETAGLEALACSDSPLISQVNRLLVQAVELRASDLHIEPSPAAVVVRVRIDGCLIRLCSLPRGMAARLAARVKIMSGLVITERRLPQDGQIRARVRDRNVEFRVSTLPGQHGEKIVLRVLGGGSVPEGVEAVGFTARDLEEVGAALKTPNGLILVTGPTGSGKTTTLYTMLKRLATPETNVVTAEDPIEYELPGVTQVQVKPAIGLTFEKALRSFLRQDPDVMLVGEIRDGETAQIAAKAAITGHLVLSTLHTNGAVETVLRLTHIGLPAYLVASAVRLVVAQRLVRKLCLRCRRPGDADDPDLDLLSGGAAPASLTAWAPSGCPECQQTGYKGRRPIFEVMPVRTAEMKSLLARADDQAPLLRQARAEGMTTLREAALAAVASGETSAQEALKATAGGN